MTRKPAAALVLLLALSGCTGDSDTPGGKVFQDPGVPTGALRLVAFDTCDDLLVGLRGAAKAAVGPWGFNNGGREMAAGGAVPDGARAAAPGGGTEDKAASAGSTSTYSKTNAHEAGADEPDLVKTDGRRIVTVAGGVVRVIDVASRRTSGSLDLAANLSGGRRPDAAPEVEAKLRAGFTNLLLAGDHVLLLGNGNFGYDLPATDSGGPGGVPGPDGKPILGTTVTLVDIAGPPKVVSSYTVDGGVLDARQIGSTARLVVRSAPRLSFDLNKSNPAERDQLAANKKVIDRAPLSDWLPRYSITDSAGKRTSGQVDCRSVHRPAEYSATALLTVLTFDLNRSTLDTGDPVSVVADGDTVYANGPSLYVANDKRWHTARLQIADGDPTAPPVVPATELYRFDISGAGKPRFAGGGKVDGWLLNQYSLSEWDGHLRVATTTDTQPGVARGAKSESAVHVLRADGTKLVEVGKVGGLGKGERIYSVRFVGPTGYVVTFRQTDPLYTLNLRDPKAPRVLGELKITGYSAYLHPAGDGRLIGIGQEASTDGRVQGTQVSLFDVDDLAAPKRLAQYHVKGAHSQAEFDPHAFLYWPATGTLAVPLANRGEAPSAGLLVLSVKDSGMTELGSVSHPRAANTRGHESVQRSLVIDRTLWTVSDHGLQANDLGTLASTGWVPFS